MTTYLRDPELAPARLKVGLLGAGFIADAHSKALARLGEVALHAVCDLSRRRAQQVAARFGIPHVLTSVAELAASDCDIVHVLLPAAHHTDAALTLVESGKGVFIEKPMGLDSAACAALCASAARRRVALGINHNFLFSRHYESLRSSVKAGELGRLDHLAAHWHFALPQLKSGPFDNWMFAAPANLLFELGVHLAAFIVDLLGLPEATTAIATNPIALPGDQTVYRHWNATGRHGAATTTLSISVSAGQSDRLLRLRGSGGSAQLDFGRDIGWRESTVTDNPIFDAYHTARATGRTLLWQARRDGWRRLNALLAKDPGANPFEDSIFRSVRAFYKNGPSQPDSRHDGQFATDVIRLCEAITRSANAGSPSNSIRRPARSNSPAKPDVLVVGGTGFIGRRLVNLLVKHNHNVRVLTRNASGAAIEFNDLPVELSEGSHADPECVKRACDGISVVYHLAKSDGKRWQDFVSGDIRPTQVLAEAALAAGVKRFIYAGTIASYASDDPREVINNRTALDPAIARRDHYARSKAACETLLQKLQRDKGLPVVIVRPGIVIGPGNAPWHPGVGRFASETRVDYWGDGTAPLPLVLVDDVADALLRVLEAQVMDGQVLLLTSPPLMSARDYVDALSKCLQTQSDARSCSPWRNWAADLIKELAKQAIRHPNRRWPSLHDWRCRSLQAHFDAGMTEELLGWHPVADRETMVARGIKDTVDWFIR